MYDSSALGKMWNVFKSARLHRKLLYLLLSQDSPEICLCCSNFCLKMVSKYFTPAHPFLWMLKPIHTQVQHQCCGLAVPVGCRNSDSDRGKAKIRGLAAMTAPRPSACCSQSFQILVFCICSISECRCLMHALAKPNLQLACSCW